MSCQFKDSDLIKKINNKLNDKTEVSNTLIFLSSMLLFIMTIVIFISKFSRCRNHAGKKHCNCGCQDDQNFEEYDHDGCYCYGHDEDFEK